MLRRKRRCNHNYFDVYVLRCMHLGLAYQPLNHPVTVQKVIYSFDGLAVEWLPVY